jgi:hypothetical protein
MGCEEPPMKFKVGKIYNHCIDRRPWYGYGFKCLFVTPNGWGVLQHKDSLRPPKLELPTEGIWELGSKADYKIEPLIVGNQMDYMED